MIGHIHNRRMAGGGRNPQVKPKALAAVAAVAASGGIVTALTKEATHGDHLAGAIIIVVVAMIAGFLLARGIGRQGKI
jgi:predicted membrane-bound spermidine synthase